MPWTSADAYKHKKKLTKKQSEVWAQVANAALEAGDDEATAIKKANAATNRMKHTEATTEAALILYEIGKTISSANMTKLKTALTSMKSAVEAIEPLIADDAQTEESITHRELMIDEEQDSTNNSFTETVWKWEHANLVEAAKILAQDDSYDNIRMVVGQALRKRAISDSLTQKAAAGTSLGYSDYYDYGSMPYIRDLYDGYVVYCMGKELYQCEYKIDSGSVELGEPTEVKVSYVPTNNSEEAKTIDVVGDLIQLQEKAVREDGTIRVKVIDPGWGSSGYYSKEMLKRDGHKVFKAGTHMYMNHPTEEESRNRPERDVRDLVGTLKSDAKWEDGNSKNSGPGLYADAVVYSNYRSFVDEAAKDIGVSIRASGTAREGEAENRHGMIIDSLHEGFSVDYVTLPGRGGQVMSLYESARTRIQTTELAQERVNVVDITQEQLDAFQENVKRTETLSAQLEEANKIIARQNEAIVISRARTIVNDILASTNLHDLTRERLAKECVRGLPLKEGTLDEEALIERTKATVAEELKYIESLVSTTGGKVVGMGSTNTTAEVTEEDIDKNMSEAWKNFGLKGKSLEVAARGRN